MSDYLEVMARLETVVAALKKDFGPPDTVKEADLQLLALATAWQLGLLAVPTEEKVMALYERLRLICGKAMEDLGIPAPGCLHSAPANTENN